MKAKEKIFGITVNEWCPFNVSGLGCCCRFLWLIEIKMLIIYSPAEQ